MTGTEIAAHNATAEPLNIFCIEDGAGFLKGHVYCIDEEGVIHDIFTNHTHASTADGGTYYEIKRANYKNMIEENMSLAISASKFKATAASTGAMTDEVDTIANTKYIQFLTAATNNDWIVGEMGGGRLYFGKPITLQIKYAVSHNSSVTYRMGCGTPRINDNVGTLAQLGFEGCTGTNTLNRVFSADGTTWTGENMSDMSQPVPFGLRIDYYPSSKIVASDGSGTIVTKTSNLPPTSTATNSISTCRVGIKTLSAATRNLKLYAIRLVGESYDSTAGLGGWC